MSIDDIEITVTSETLCSGDEDCDDGNFCNGAESCVDGVCQSGPTVDCDDGIACTADLCNESNDSCENVINNAACDDGLFCNGDETCSATLGCQAGSDPCPGQGCDEENDECLGGSNDQMYVSVIEVTKERRRWSRRSIAKVQVMDTKGSQVEGAIVIGQWSGGANDTDQSSTNSYGWVYIYSNWSRRNSTFTFCVTDVFKEGWEYNPDKNSALCNSAE